jgi:hypothetical protein
VREGGFGYRSMVGPQTGHQATARADFLIWLISPDRADFLSAMIIDRRYGSRKMFI